MTTVERAKSYPRDYYDCNYSEAVKSRNPVHKHHDGTWWFYDENWYREKGPFKLEEECRMAAVTYARGL